MLIINTIAVLLHIALGLYLLKRYPRHTVWFGLALFVQTWSVISCFYNDLGVYNFELFRFTETTLATSRLVVFNLLFNGGFLLTARLLEKHPLRRREYSLSRTGIRMGNLKLIGFVLIATVIGYVGYQFYTEGIPVLEGVHKLLFFQQASPVERFLINWGPFIAFVLGYFRSRRRRISWSGVLLFLLLIFLAAAGNKFSAFIRVLVPYYAAVLVVHLKEHPSFTILRRRYLAYALAVFFGLVLMAYGSYMYFGRDSVAALQLLWNRLFALQGHLWWATDYNLFVLDAYDPAHWLTELRGVLSPENVSEAAVGLKYVMVQAIGADRAFPIFDIGYLYTMGYPAILTLTFPYPVAMLIQTAMGGIFAVLLYYFHYSVEYRHFFRALVALTVVLPLVSMLNSGNFSVFMTGGLVVKILVLVVMETGIACAPTSVSAGAGSIRTADIRGDSSRNES